jgi:hypothetical protein
MDVKVFYKEQIDACKKTLETIDIDITNLLKE